MNERLGTLEYPIIALLAVRHNGGPEVLLSHRFSDDLICGGQRDEESNSMTGEDEFPGLKAMSHSPLMPTASSTA